MPPGDATLSRDEPAPERPALLGLTGEALIPIAYVLLSLVGLAGLWAGDVPLAVDFPNHAARLFIECNIGDPALARMYLVEYSLIPNLAIDLLNQPFCGLVDPMTFLRGTLVLT